MRGARRSFFNVLIVDDVSLAQARVSLDVRLLKVMVAEARRMLRRGKVLGLNSQL